MSPYPIKPLCLVQSNSGIALLWVMILLFFVASSSLIVAQKGMAQYRLIEFYDQRFIQAKALRALERIVHSSLVLSWEAGELPKCVQDQSEIMACDFTGQSTHRSELEVMSLFTVLGRQLAPSEAGQFDYMMLDDLSVTQERWIELRVIYQSPWSGLKKEQERWFYRLTRGQYSNVLLEKESEGVKLESIDVKRVLAWSI